VTCRLLCCSLLRCSVDLYALLLCGHRAECRNGRVSLVYRIVSLPSFIGASCSTHVLESVITTNSIHCANHFFPRLNHPWFDRSTQRQPTPLHRAREGRHDSGIVAMSLGILHISCAVIQGSHCSCAATKTSPEWTSYHCGERRSAWV
jgi:hypothetical protein